MSRTVARVSADKILAALKRNFNAPKAVNLFLDPAVRPHHAHEALSVLRESRSITPQFYEQYCLFFAALGDMRQVTEGLKLAEKDEIKLDASQILVYALSISGDVDKAYNLLQKEVARGAAPTLARAYSSVINRLTRIGRIAEAQDALSWSHAFSTPDIRSYHALLFYYRKKHDIASAFRLYGQLKARKLAPDIVVFCELLHMLAHDDPRVARLFADMRTFGVVPSVIAHNIVMAKEGRAGDVEAVRARFAEMHAQNLLPNEASYVALLAAYKTRRDPVGAQGVLNEMRSEGLQPDSYCYVQVAGTMALAGDVHGQRQLLAQMDAERVEVTHHFLDCITDAQGQQPAWVLAEMRQRGVTQQVNTHEMQLRMLNATDPTRAMRVYREMRAQGLFPSEKAITSLIHTLRKSERVWECKEILLDLDKAGMKLNIKVYNMVLGMLSKAKDLETCTTILSTMKNHGPTPDEITYQSLALGFGSAGLGHLALHTLRAARAAGFAARTVYSAVVRALATMGWSDEMANVLVEMCKEGIATAKTFSDALRFNFKNKALCLKLFELMKIRNVRRDVTVYNIMVRMAKYHDDLALAFELTAQMRAEGIALDATTYAELIHIAAKHDDFDTCAQLIERMYCDGADCAPNAGTYACVIVELLRSQRVNHERAQYFFDDMLAHGIAPIEEDVLHWLVKVYCAAGAFTQAWDAYERARKALKGLMHRNTHNTLLLECMWRGDTSRCDALLDAAGELDTKLIVTDFDKVFANAGDRRGCDVTACARVYSRMGEFGLEPHEATRKLVARIYAQHAPDEGRDFEGERDVENLTKEYLEKVPEINTKSTQERLRERLDLERDLERDMDLEHLDLEGNGNEEGKAEERNSHYEINKGGT